jgi:hypothetical protein
LWRRSVTLKRKGHKKRPLPQKQWVSPQVK